MQLSDLISLFGWVDVSLNIDSIAKWSGMEGLGLSWGFVKELIHIICWVNGEVINALRWW